MRRAQRPPRRPRSSNRAAAAPSDRVPYRDLRATRAGISSVLTRRSASAGLQRLEAGAGAALDAGGDQPVDIEAMAHQFENPQLLLRRFAIDSRDVAGQRIGGFAQIGG